MIMMFDKSTHNDKTSASITTSTASTSISQGKAKTPYYSIS